MGQVSSFDWSPAFGVYRRIVESHAGVSIDASNFFDIAKSYPLGLLKVDGEMVVRDPYRVEGDTLYVVDDIPEGEYVCVMHGDTPSLLEGAQLARRGVEQELGHALAVGGDLFCIDCISRVLYMQDDFSEELRIIKGKQQLYGALTIGEIASAGSSYLEIYNKTLVVAKW